jgi:hypothetical protein
MAAAEQCEGKLKENEITFKLIILFFIKCGIFSTNNSITLLFFMNVFSLIFHFSFFLNSLKEKTRTKVVYFFAFSEL